MNAIKFIQHHGVEKAREVVGGAPEGAQYYRDMDSVCHPNEVLYYAWFGGALLVIDEHEGWVKSIFHNGAEYILDQLEKVDDLKLLVESVDLVGKVGGISQAKSKVRQAKGQGYQTISIPVEIDGSIGMGCLYIDTLEKAIADYEAIGGEHV